MNNVTHHIRFATNDLSVISASAFVPVYGCLAKLSITTFSQNDAYGYGRRTRVSYGFRAATKDDYYREPFPLDGRISFPLNGRRIEQKITLPPLSGEILQSSYLCEAGEDAGRFVAAAILRCYESVMDDARQHIRRNVPKGEVTDAIGNTYSHPTMQALSRALAGVNWKLLFSKAGCEERTVNVIDYTLLNNPARCNEFRDDTLIPAWNNYGKIYENHELDRRLNEAREAAEADQRRRDAEQREARRAALAQADSVAVDMMYDVLGPAAVDSYQKTGAIHVENEGYKFKIERGRWIKCTDPKGGTAQLCIHTVSLSCHPVDEMVLAALNIKHHFHEFMEMAIAHDRRDFTLPTPPKKSKKS